jgi:Zn-dependent protease
VTGPGAYAAVILYTLPGLVVGLVLHELAHVALATRFGDPTARRERRMTLDPRRHLDALGVAALLACGFGWARPVLLNPPFLQGRLRRFATVAAGPLAHVVVAAAFAAALRIELATSGIDIGGFVTTAAGGTAQGIVTGVLLQGFFINVALCIYSLVPLPGLDGYALVRSVLFPRGARIFLTLEQWRFVVYAGAVVAIVLPAELSHGAVNPLAVATSGTASLVFAHAVDAGAEPIFLGLPNIFMAFT